MTNLNSSGFLMFAIVLVVALIALVYIPLSIFLNKFHTLKYGKSSIIAWIPILNLYILGKLVFNQIVGYILVVSILIVLKINITINNLMITYQLIPDKFYIPVCIIYTIIMIAISLFAIKKYFDLKKTNANIVENNNVVETLDAIPTPNEPNTEPKEINENNQNQVITPTLNEESENKSILDNNIAQTPIENNNLEQLNEPTQAETISNEPVLQPTIEENIQPINNLNQVQEPIKVETIIKEPIPMINENVQNQNIESTIEQPIINEPTNINSTTEEQESNIFNQAPLEEIKTTPMPNVEDNKLNEINPELKKLFNDAISQLEDQTK